MSAPEREADPHDARHALRAAGALAAFNLAGVLAGADVHVAQRLGALADEASEPVLLAVALAVRGPRLGHVYVELETIAASATVETDTPVDLTALPWPDPGAWVAAVAASPLVTGDGVRPLRLSGTRLYLERYWQEEQRLAADLLELASCAASGVTTTPDAAHIARLWPEPSPDGLPERAAAIATAHGLTVLAGGPGTGKTTTVARIVALLLEQAAGAGRPAPLVALAAPTGKAAARLEEALHAEAKGLDVSAETRAELLALSASTLHRLLGWRPDSHSRFRHHRGNRLPHDVVVVDETSMVSLSLMGRLVEAIRPGARLVLVGDPGQLASIEAGAVLGDVVGSGQGDDPIAKGTVVLRHVHRFGGNLADLSEAIAAGDADATLAVLRRKAEDITWLDVDVAADRDALEPVRVAAVAAGRKVVAAATRGDAQAALEALGTFRLLCAHRRGPHGAATWRIVVERWLADAIPGFRPEPGFHLGRPLLVTQNDYGAGLYNGDTGVVVAAPEDRLVAAFERRGAIVSFSPGRLGALETVHAMTIHKSQGSQFATTAVLLPDAASPLLTRELLYTAVTRAQRHVILVGAEDAVRRAVTRPIARASGLAQLLH